MRRAALIIGSSLSVLPLGGCLVSSASATRIDGAYVQPSAVASVDEHRSTKQDVLNALSEPSSKVVHDDGCETWSWHWTRTDAGAGSVFLIFSGESKKQIEQSVHVKFDEDGVVMRKWRD
jgi:outer membrane protein assembly factor BamE (lipoprotein component of BamABCDE complex)